MVLQQHVHVVVVAVGPHPLADSIVLCLGDMYIWPRRSELVWPNPNQAHFIEVRLAQCAVMPNIMSIPIQISPRKPTSVEVESNHHGYNAGGKLVLPWCSSSLVWWPWDWDWDLLCSKTKMHPICVATNKVVLSIPISLSSNQCGGMQWIQWVSFLGP